MSTELGIVGALLEARPIGRAAAPRPRPGEGARQGALTLPEDIRRALHIGVGDEVEFSLNDDGTVTVRGFVSIPTD
jgi:hypothetical protein